MDISEQLFERAKRVLPGGVNSPVRAYRAVGMAPRFITRADGAYIYDEDGKRYIDYVCSWGPMILGHNHPVIREAVEQAVRDGLSFGAPTRREVEIAELMIGMVPNIEMVRMVNSGTEAVMSALRLARGATGRDKLIKFEGCYHGHSDCMLVNAGSSALAGGHPSSAGVPVGAARDTLTAQFNDLASVEVLLEQNPGQVAAVIVEPVAANMGVVGPAPGFLAGLRALCDKHGALLIFDEVITGFRLAPGGAQAYFGVRADPSARSAAATCRWAPTAAAARCWSRWPPAARCTRRAPSAATRWPWPPAWPSSPTCGSIPRYTSTSTPRARLWRRVCGSW